MARTGREILGEIENHMQILIQQQESLLSSINELKEEQKKLKDEIKMSNLVLNTITINKEMIN